MCVISYYYIYIYIYIYMYIYVYMHIHEPVHVMVVPLYFSDKAQMHGNFKETISREFHYSLYIDVVNNSVSI